MIALGPGAELGRAAPDALLAVEIPIEVLDPDAVVALGAGFAFDARPGPGATASVFGIGEAARLELSGEDRWERVRERAAEIASSIGGPAASSVHFVGGAEFEPAGAAIFIVPRWTLIHDARGRRAILVARARELASPGILEEARAISTGAARRRVAGRALPTGVVADDGAEAFVARVRAALAAIERGDVEKLVVGRKVRVALDGPADPSTVWARIRASEPTAIGLLWRAGESSLVAASPERLVVRRGGEALADALAGTAPRRGAPADEGEAERELLSSDKDLREHEVVVRAVERAFSEAGGSTSKEGPVVRSLRTLHHLATEVRGRFALESEGSSAPHVLTLAAALHPTPAVAGAPTEAALRFLAQHEPDRGWFTGALGWFRADGDGAFAVVLRAARIERGVAELFAGTGIVRGSQPDRELEETEVKLAAARRALGLAEGAPHGSPAVSR